MHYALLALVLVLMALLIGNLPHSAVVLDGGQQVCRLNQSFSLRWRHSVEQSIWQEDYQLKDGKLFLKQTHIQSFGAGTPAALPLSEQQQQGMVSMDVQRRMEVMYWVVSPQVASTVLFEHPWHGAQTWAIYQSFPPYHEIRIEALSKPLFSWRTIPYCHA